MENNGYNNTPLDPLFQEIGEFLGEERGPTEQLNDIPEHSLNPGALAEELANRIAGLTPLLASLPLSGVRLRIREDDLTINRINLVGEYRNILVEQLSSRQPPTAISLTYPMNDSPHITQLVITAHRMELGMVRAESQDSPWVVAFTRLGDEIPKSPASADRVVAALEKEGCTQFLAELPGLLEGTSERLAKGLQQAAQRIHGIFERIAIGENRRSWPQQIRAARAQVCTIERPYIANVENTNIAWIMASLTTPRPNDNAQPEGQLQIKRTAPTDYELSITCSGRDEEEIIQLHLHGNEQKGNKFVLDHASIVPQSESNGVMSKRLFATLDTTLAYTERAVGVSRIQQFIGRIASHFTYGRLNKDTL